MVQSIFEHLLEWYSYCLIFTVLVTMTTVGYGDYFAKTTVGRIMGLMIAFWGVFIVSLFTVTLSNLFEFNQSEQKVKVYLM